MALFAVLDIGGLFIWEVERLHKVHGPIVRISPREAHLQDSDYYEEIYASSARKREKDPVLVAQFGLDGSGFASIDAESHRQRRAPVERLFSKRAIENMEGLIHKVIDKPVYYVEEAHQSHSVVRLDAGFAALTSDTIMNAVPIGILEKLNPPAFALASQKRTCTCEAKRGDISIDTPAATAMPEHLRSPERRMNESFALVVGGTETTARTLAVGIWHIYTSEDIRRKLREELKTVMTPPDTQPSWNDLEKLPYLSGVISKSLRLSTGVANRSPQAAPTEALVYKGYTIPPGTPVSETHHLILMDPEIFSSPDKFDPERWGRAAAKGMRLEKYLVNFFVEHIVDRFPSNVSSVWPMQSSSLVIGTMVRRFDIEMYPTPKANIEFARVFGTPWPDKGGLSVQATITRVITE
ncbi:cytochrome P450 [Aspergillus spectabilis]